MPFKTVLAIIQDDDGAERVSGSACAIAERFDAHLIGLHAETLPMPHVSVMGFPDTELLQAASEANRERTDAIRKVFAQAAADAGIDHEWQSLEGFSGDPALAGLGLARCSDLIVAAQAAPEGASADIGGLLYDAGRPVLVMPHEAPCLASFRRVVVAWNGSREAARAAFDAIPFIVEADRTEILCIDPENGDGSASGAGIAAALARHGAVVTVHAEETRGRSVDEAMIDRLAATGADLLVLGAYSHSWLRERLFGGVTRSAVASMPVTTFLSR